MENVDGGRRGGRLKRKAARAVNVATTIGLLLVQASQASPQSGPCSGLDGQVLRDLLYAADLDGDTVTWPAGTYCVGKDPLFPDIDEPNFAFVLHPDLIGIAPDHVNRTNLTIEASGVNLIIVDPRTGVFSITECHGLIIKGLTVTYDPLPYNQSTITAVDTANHTFTVTLDTGYLGFEDSRFHYGEDQGLGVSCWGSLFDASTKLLKAGTTYDFMKLAGYQSLGGLSYRLTVVDNPNYLGYLSHFAVGDRFAFLSRREWGNTFSLNKCEPTGAPFNRPPVTIENCTAEAGSGQFIEIGACPMISDTGQAVVRGCTITNVSSDRLISTDSGGINAKGCRVGPLVENCNLQRCMDDVFWFTSPRRLFMGYPYTGNFWVVDLNVGPRIAVNDRLQFMVPATGQYATFTVLDINPNNDAGYDGGHWEKARVVLDASVPGMSPGTGDPGTDVATATHSYNLDTSNEGFLIKNNTIGNCRHYGAVIAPNTGTFRDNTVTNCSASGILMANHYGHGPVPEGAVVRNNTVTNCGFTGYGSAIAIGGQMYSGGWSSYKTARNLVVEGNTIVNWNPNPANYTSAGIYARAIKDSVIRSSLNGKYNEFYWSPSPYPEGPSTTRAVIVASPAGAMTVSYIDADDGTGSDLDFMPYAVRIENGVDADVTVTLSTIIVELPTQKLQDLR